MTKTLSDLLSELNEELIKAQSPLTDILQDGLNRNLINDQTKKSGIEFLPEMYELYQWRNSIKEEELDDRPIGEFLLFTMGIFPPLNVAIKDFNSERDIYWDKMLFSLFGSGGGDYFLINCNKEQATHGMIFYYSPSNVDFDGMISKYDSLMSLIITIIECYKSRAYYYEFNKELLFLDSSFELENKISKEFNPESEYWKIFKYLELGRIVANFF